GFASYRHFTHAIRTGINDAQLHSSYRLSPPVGAEGPEIVHRDGGARLRASVTVGDLDAEIVEKFQSLGLGERSANQERAQSAAKGLVNILQKKPAQPELGTPASRHAIHAHECV